MRRLLHPFVLVVSAILVLGYTYIAARLTSTAPLRVALAAPFVMVWILPVVYWFGGRERHSRMHEWLKAWSFVCMGWLSFLLVLTATRDVLLVVTTALPPLQALHTLLDEWGAAWVPVAALAAVGVGALAALWGPYVRRIDIPVEGLAPDLDGFRIVQISDLSARRSHDATGIHTTGCRYDQEAGARCHRADRRHRGRIGALAGVACRAAAGAGVRGPSILRARQSRLLLGGGAVDGSLRGDGISGAPEHPRHHRAWLGTSSDRGRYRFRCPNVRS